ncbi:LacI family transcriptional regulator [Pseudooceanicola sp. CBS1P-1]|uniref:LacI family DNA-binding transcriptional regulator n=1 Tax=Pseudooceanicola albus TaxID=2692189 RepID=A0A6L7G5J1_9RHOB|nr:MULTISPECIES: LacI family DNA-binding transcriptional regulator [Pseudooceanicola]MBT9386190.1 LacI family transcriptional regulator [Pseudooceanicola endophyticus]MXN19395.1 LacI family DNA-binding transcriptional regulator [Pseudooceanicola albus]
MAGSSRPRISDIAQKLGVSTATVSRALSGNGYVREALATRIRSVAIEMNYAMPGTAAGQKALIVSSQDAIIDFKRSQFTMYVLEGLRDRAEAQDIRLETHIYQGSRDLAALKTATEDEALIGLLLVSVDEHVLDFVRGLDVPAVLVNGDDPEMCLSSVTPCNRSAAALATRHLVRMGHERIAFLSRPGRRTITRRLEGWRDVLGSGATKALELEVEDWTAEAAAETITRALDAGLAFTGVVAAADILAAGAIQAIQTRGLSVPGDISVIGIDGLPQGQYMSPALTSVRIPMPAVGGLSLDLLVETVKLRTAGVQMPSRRIELACELLHRASAGPAPQG